MRVLYCQRAALTLLVVCGLLLTVALLTAEHKLLVPAVSSRGG